MRGKRAGWVAAIATLVCAAPLRAHHSISMFDISNTIWVKGTVVRYEPVNPHAFIALEEKRPDGKVRRWTVEGPILARLNRMGVGRDFLKTGDVIEVCGFALKQKKDISMQDSWRETDGSLPSFVHGHMIVMPEGTLRPWGPYGKLQNCVRPEDQKQSWVNFLDQDPVARDLWCARISSSAPTRADSKTLVDAIDRLIANPCQ